MALVFPQSWTTGGTYSSAANDVWYHWNDGTGSWTTGSVNLRPTTYSTTVTVNVNQEEVWYHWNDVTPHTWNTVNEVRAHGQVIWREWNDDVEAVARREADRQRALDAAQARREERSRRRLELAPKLEGARERAEELLAFVLTEDEMVQWLRDEEVTIRGSEGGLYKVAQYGLHGNVHQVDEHGCVLAHLCAAPRMWDDDLDHHLPNADGHVGQILQIKCDEMSYVARANFSYRRECQQRPASPAPLAA